MAFLGNTSQAGIDYVEGQDGQLSAFALKWNPKAKTKFPKAFTEAYRPFITQVIHRENYWEWIGS